MTQTLKLNLDNRGYDIKIGSNILQSAGSEINAICAKQKYFIVTDKNVAPIYLKKLQKSLNDAGLENHSFILKAGEQTKSFTELTKLLDNIFEHTPERKSTLIALGGGVIGDLTGFAASLILRGVNFIQIPTTLLAQVDSSVGGKTGINNKFGKNLIGSFYQPRLVLIDTETLKTLPRREFLAGYAEVVKYGLINDAEFFNWLDRNLDKTLNFDDATIKEIIKKCCSAKASIVAEDEKETGARALLNLGHTFGHALEKLTGYSDTLLHGESVAIGTIFAIKLSIKLKLTNETTLKKVEEHFFKAGLKTSPLQISKKWDENKLLQAMSQDKKVSDGKLTFILMKDIGESFIQKDVDSNIVLETIREVTK